MCFRRSSLSVEIKRIPIVRSILFSIAYLISTQLRSTQPDENTIDRVGNSAALGLTALSFITALSLSWYFRFRNNQKRSQQLVLPEPGAEKINSIVEQGAKHPGMQMGKNLFIGKVADTVNRFLLYTLINAIWQRVLTGWKPQT